MIEAGALVLITVKRIGGQIKKVSASKTVSGVTSNCLVKGGS